MKECRIEREKKKQHKINYIYFRGQFIKILTDKEQHGDEPEEKERKTFFYTKGKTRHTR